MGNTWFEIIRILPGDTSYKDQMDALSSQCFGWMVESEESRIQNEDQFFSDKFLHILAIENKTVIGKVGLVKRVISYEGSDIILGGLGGMCTAENQRNKGVASALLQKALNELKKAGCDICYLCTDVEDIRLVRLYEKVGFKVLGKPHSYYGKSGKLYTENDAMITLLNSLELFQKVMNGKTVFHIGHGNW